MSRHGFALAANSVSVSGSNLTWVVIVAVVALLAPCRKARRHTCAGSSGPSACS